MDYDYGQVEREEMSDDEDFNWRMEIMYKQQLEEEEDSGVQVEEIYVEETEEELLASRQYRRLIEEAQDCSLQTEITYVRGSEEEQNDYSPESDIIYMQVSEDEQDCSLQTEITYVRGSEEEQDCSLQTEITYVRGSEEEQDGSLQTEITYVRGSEEEQDCSLQTEYIYVRGSEEERRHHQQGHRMTDSEESKNEMTPHDVEKLEEEKLKAKYPAGVAAGRAISGHSAFLQKRLAKGKYFDSGDYQMAKQKMGGVNKQPLKVSMPVNPYATGEAIPTPESVPARKTSIIQQSKFNPNVG